MKQERIGRCHDAWRSCPVSHKNHQRRDAFGKCLYIELKIYLFAIVGQLIEFLGKAKEGKQSEKEICAIAQARTGLSELKNIGRLLTAIE